MVEQEPPIEHVHEEIHRHAEGSREKWVSGVALSAALLAALAAVATLFSGHDANEALLEQMRASDQWAYYQAKGIKSAVLSAKAELLAAGGKGADAGDRDKIAAYEKQQEEIFAEAKGEEASSRVHLARHVVLSRGVTLFQMAIVVAAISVLTKRKAFWFVGLGFGAVGVAFLVRAMLMGVVASGG